jgi:AraC family transcriptional regulator, arabinose operon regulatory protein
MQFATSPELRAPPFCDGRLAFGALSAVMKDNFYWFGSSGFIFTSPWVVTPNTVRHAAVVLLTASGEPVEVTAGSSTVKSDFVAIAPLTPRGLRAMNVGLVSIHVFPPHPRFRAFQGIRAPGVLQLDRSRLVDFGPALVRAYEGRLSLREARELFDGVVEAAVRQLPPTGSRDWRAERLHEILRENPACSLPQLARELRLSYTGTSHCFSRTVGLPLRSYQLWLKYFNAENLRLKGVALTSIAHAAGFSDSSHLSRTWQASYGMSPSYTLDQRRVRTFV